MIGIMANAVLLVEKIAPLNNLDHIPTCNINRCCCKAGGESRKNSVSHSLMAATCGRSQAVSKTRLTFTASGFGCP